VHGLIRDLSVIGDDKLCGAWQLRLVSANTPYPSILLWGKRGTFLLHVPVWMTKMHFKSSKNAIDCSVEGVASCDSVFMIHNSDKRFEWLEEMKRNANRS
jgi:hypothetical protein